MGGWLRDRRGSVLDRDAPGGAGGGCAGSPTIQVFASDIDEAAVALAREGLYTLNDAADVSPERLRRFFTKEGEAYRVRKELREIVLFAHHDIIKDPPFSHLDLVVLPQHADLPEPHGAAAGAEIMHFALNPGGILFLGSSESVEGSGELFVAADGDAHIFQSRPVASRLGLPLPDPLAVSRIGGVHPDTSAAEARARQRLSSADLHVRLLESTHRRRSWSPKTTRSSISPSARAPTCSSPAAIRRTTCCRRSVRSSGWS